MVEPLRILKIYRSQKKSQIDLQQNHKRAGLPTTRSAAGVTQSAHATRAGSAKAYSEAAGI